MPFPFPCTLMVVPVIMLFICGAFTIERLSAADQTPERQRDLRRMWTIGGIVSGAYVLLVLVAFYMLFDEG